MQDIIETVQEYLNDKGIDIVVDENTLLMSDGLLDSMDMFALFLDLQKRFDLQHIDFEDEDDVMRLDTVKGISELLP